MSRDGQNKGKLECVIDKSCECHRLCRCVLSQRRKEERERERARE